MVIENLISLGDVLDLPFRGRVIHIANNVDLATYLQSINALVNDPTTIAVLSKQSKNLGTLYGQLFIQPTELITDGEITDEAQLTPYREIPKATYTGWVAGACWEQAPYGFFMNMSLSTRELAKVAREAQATRLLLAVSQTQNSNSGLTLGQPLSFPFNNHF